MRLMMAEKSPETAFRQRRGHAAKAQCLGHHEEHDKATIGVERGQSLRLGLRYAGRHREWPNKYLGGGRRERKISRRHKRGGVRLRMVAADIRRRILARKTLPPRYLGGYG